METKKWEQNTRDRSERSSSPIRHVGKKAYSRKTHEIGYILLWYTKKLQHFAPTLKKGIIPPFRRPPTRVGGLLFGQWLSYLEPWSFLSGFVSLCKMSDICFSFFLLGGEWTKSLTSKSQLQGSSLRKWACKTHILSVTLSGRWSLSNGTKTWRISHPPACAKRCLKSILSALRIIIYHLNELVGWYIQVFIVCNGVWGPPKSCLFPSGLYLPL